MALIPKDLQRFTTDGPNIHPQYIKAVPSVIELVEQIADCFRYSSDETYGMLCDSLEPLCTGSQRHRLIRGIIHILEARLSFEESLEVDPFALREALFKRAGRIGAKDFISPGWRDRIFDEIAAEMSISTAQIESSLYADLKSERMITGFDDLEAEQIIAEYNLSLAKSLLLYARSLVFTVVFENASSQGIRRLFQALRFFNLLFDAQPITETAWQFTVDGPSAVLPQPQKYATSLAAFLPSLYAFSAWHATSSVKIDSKSYTWQLKPDDFEPPVMHFPERIPVEAERLADRICELAPDLTTHHKCPILNFGPQAVWIPDFTIENIDTGAQAHVEVVGFWRADYLNRRLKMLKNAPKNLILVVSDKLKADKADLRSPVEIVTFKRTPRPQDVIACAHKLGL